MIVTHIYVQCVDECGLVTSKSYRWSFYAENYTFFFYIVTYETSTTCIIGLFHNRDVLSIVVSAIKQRNDHADRIIHRHRKYRYTLV